MSTEIVAINLTDVRDDGTDEPLSAALLELACSAAKVASSPFDLVAAQASLASLAATVRPALPLLADLVANLLRLVDAAGTAVEGAGDG